MHLSEGNANIGNAYRFRIVIPLPHKGDAKTLVLIFPDDICLVYDTQNFLHTIVCTQRLRGNIGASDIPHQLFYPTVQIAGDDKAVLMILMQIIHNGSMERGGVDDISNALNGVLLQDIDSCDEPLHERNIPPDRLGGQSGNPRFFSQICCDEWQGFTCGHRAIQIKHRHVLHGCQIILQRLLP